MNRLTMTIHEWSLKHLSEHISFRLFGRRVTIYGANAMWFATNIHTRRWGYVCFRPPTWNQHFRWELYVSPNATPGCSTFAIGPGMPKDEKRRAYIRRKMLGHNFRVDDWDYTSILHIDYAGPIPAVEA